MENDILRQIYEGRYSAIRFNKSEAKEFLEADEILNKLNHQLVEILDKDGSISSTKFLNDWGDAWFAMTNEELIETYKRGAQFGFQLAFGLSEKIDN